MKNQLRRLKALEKMIDLNVFYAIHFFTDEVCLQGKFDSSLVVALRALRFTGFAVNDNGHVVVHRPSVRVVLT